MGTGLLLDFLSQSADGPMQELVLEKAKRTFNVFFFFVIKLAIKLGKEVLDNDLSFGFKFLVKAGNNRAIFAPGPIMNKLFCFLVDDGFGLGNMAGPFFQGIRPDFLQIINVEKADTIPIVNARFKISGNSDIQDHQGPAGPLGFLSVKNGFGDDWLLGSGGADNDVGKVQGILHVLPRQDGS